MRGWLKMARIVVSIIVVVGAAAMTGCTLSQGDGEGDSAPRVVTATLSGTVGVHTDVLVTPDAEILTQVALQMQTTTAPTATATNTASPTPTASETASATASATATTAAPPATVRPATETIPAVVASVTPLPSATSTPTATLTATLTATTPPSTTPEPTDPPTVTPPPSNTPPPTVPPSPVPTRTLPGPTAMPPLDDGSGNPVAGTGSDTLVNPVAGVEALPYTLYYLSDVGNLAQVFRLRIGLNHPDQLTYSMAGVSHYSAAPDGTLAYSTPDGQMLVGGIPVVLPANNDGTPAQVTALAWSPAGDWLAYVLAAPDGEPHGGVWMMNRSGTTVQLDANDDTAGAQRVYTGPLNWHPDGNEFLAGVQTGEAAPFVRVNIGTNVVTPLWNDSMLAPDAYTEARWNVNGNAIIASGGGRVLRVDPGSQNVSVLLTEGAGLAVSDATQWADGSVTFTGRDADGSARLYRLAPGATSAQPVTDVLTAGGAVDFLLGNDGVTLLVNVVEPADARLGGASWRGTDGIPRDLTPLTGLVGTPRWGPPFQRNDWARIRTTDGEALNIRAAPSLQGQVTLRLVNGTRVAIIGGPRIAEGYRWWQVRTTDGAAGWAVEAVEDSRGLLMRTLLPVN